MLETLNNLDKDLFLFLNGMNNATFDGIMFWISGKTTWWPFYLLLLGFLAWTKRWQFFPVIFFVVLTVVLADQGSVHLFKEVFHRLRPCHDPELSHLVHLINGKCGGQYGFVSSHAANVFGIATFLSLLVRKWWFTATLLFWASLVGYSRIYLGVHYPGDVIGGALLGGMIGYGLSFLYQYLIPRLPDSWKMNSSKL